MNQILDKKNMIPAIILLLVIALITAGYFTYKGNGKTEIIKYEGYTISEGHTGKIEKYDPSMAVDGYTGGEKAYYITGKIKSSEDEGYTIITFNLYDEDDKVLGTAIAGLNSLEKDKEYDFKALSLIEEKDIEKIEYYKLKTVEQG